MNFAGNYEPLAAFLLVWTAKATVLLGLAWVISFALRRRSAALRHRVWAIAIISSLALPVISLVIPAWHVFSAPSASATNISQTMVVTNVAEPLPVAVVPESRFDTEAFVGVGLLVWTLGTILVAFRLLVGLARLWRISVYSKRLPENACAALDELRALFGIRRKVRLLEAPGAAMMPMTWGIFRPRIVLPSDAGEWEGERRRIVLSHELAHVARNDWPLQICAEAMRACFWFHPLAWIAANQMRQESERACDDAVLNSGIAAREYASQLLALAQTLKAPGWRFSLALAIARPSNLERRFAAMLDSSISRSPLSRTTGIFATVLGACLLLPVAALTLSAEGPVQARSGISAPETASLVLPHSEAATASALLTSENHQSTLPAVTPRHLSGVEPKPTAISPERQISAQSPATTQTSAPGAVGSISGTVGDPSGARVPRAVVTLMDITTGQQEQATASDAGEFAFSSVIPDNYELSVQQPGFKVYKQQIQLSPNEGLKLPELLLSVGAVTQTVEVSASRTGSGSHSVPSGMVTVSACPASLQAAQLAYKNPVQPGPAPSRIRVGGNVESARLVQQTLPIYPDAARAAGVQGTVVMNAIIGKDGTLLSACVASGPPSLARSALDAVSQWRYSPTLLNGEPVEVMTEIQAIFTLRD